MKQQSPTRPSRRIYGGNIEETENYTVAGTLSDYAALSNLTMLFGDYLTDADNENKNKVCVLGYSAEKQIFGSASDAYDSIVYIDDRPYTVGGVLAEQGTVESGISADEAIFIPYETGIKYLTGTKSARPLPLSRRMSTISTP